MRPSPDQMLGLLAQTLLTDLAPALRDGYAQRGAQLVGMLLMMLVEEWDRAAERLVDENRALRALFADAAPQVTDPALRERIEAASNEDAGSLKISALNRTNDALRALLIDLHAHVEELDTEPARVIEARIWSELRRSTDRRQLSLAP